MVAVQYPESLMSIFGDIRNIPDDLGEATEYYHNQGFFVIPLDMTKKGKQPLINWKRGTPTPRLETLIKKARFGGGIGIRVPNNMIVVDLDVDKSLNHRDPNFYTGLNTLAEMFMDEDPECLSTITVHTPSSGIHLYYSSPILIGKTSAGQLGPGIDTRVGPTGIVVVPPSFGEHWVGKYRFDDEFDEIRQIPLRISRELVADGAIGRKAQDFWANMVFPEPTISENTSEVGKSMLRLSCRRIETAPRGTRNSEIYAQGFKIFRAVASGLISVSDAESNIWNSARLRSMQSGKGLDCGATIASARNNGISKPYTKQQVAGFERKFKLGTGRQSS